MKIRQLIALAALVAIGALHATALQAQTQAASKPSTTETAEPKVAIKLMVTLTEYDGATKISSLPYVIPLAIERPYSVASVRVGARVPVKTETSKSGEESINFIDIGTNIDVSGSPTADGRYAMMITVDRSSLYVPYRDKDGAVQAKDWVAGDLPPTNLQPMIRQFRAKVSYLLRDGQPGEIASTTDPLSGRVLKIEVVATALK